MKTPREILLQRHQAAQPALDAIRKNVVANLSSPVKAAPPARNFFKPAFIAAKLWQELIWPCRRIWAGMAAVWLVILALGLAREERGVAVADNQLPPPDARIALKAQRQMMAQLLDPAGPVIADRPRIPGPRSEQPQTTMIG